jgi:hypothetical protein
VKPKQSYALRDQQHFADFVGIQPFSAADTVLETWSAPPSGHPNIHACIDMHAYIHAHAHAHAHFTRSKQQFDQHKVFSSVLKANLSEGTKILCEGVKG